MELAIRDGLSQKWGNKVWIDVTNIMVPEGAFFYQIILNLKLVGGKICFNHAVMPGVFTNELHFDLSPYIRSAGDYQLEWGETYLSGGTYITTMFPDDIHYFEMINEVISVNQYFTVPMGLVQLSGNPIQVIVPTTTQKMAGKNNYKLLLKASCASLLGSPFVEEIIPDSNKLAKFDISGLIEQPVDYEFTYPPVGIITDHRPLEFNVALDTGESWIDANGNRQENWNNLASNTYFLRVLKGKLRPHELAIFNEVGQNFTTEYIEKGRFLTHLPDYQQVAPGQIVKLWYLSRFTTTVNAVWYCHVTQMTNYGPHTYTDLTGTFTLDPASGLLEFNVEPIFMGFNRTVTEQFPILSYKFWLCSVDNGIVISESRTFLVDPSYYETMFYFLYVNPLSGIDCLRLTGEYSKNLNASSETLYQPVPIGSGTKVPSLKTVSVTGQRSWEINSGFKTAEEMSALRDFLESKNCWMADPDNPLRLIPVLVEKDKFILFDSMNDVHSINLKITEAHR